MEADSQADVVGPKETLVPSTCLPNPGLSVLNQRQSCQGFQGRLMRVANGVGLGAGTIEAPSSSHSHLEEVPLRHAQVYERIRR